MVGKSPEASGRARVSLPGQIDPACERATFPRSRQSRRSTCALRCRLAAAPPQRRMRGSKTRRRSVSRGSPRLGPGPPHARPLRAATCPAAPDRGGFGVFMAASPLATVVSVYVNQICLGFGGPVNGSGEATRNARPPLGTASGSMQRVPQAQGPGASQPQIRKAGVCDLRRSRAPARGIVPWMCREEGAAGPRAVLRVLQARMAVRAGAGRHGEAGTPPRERRPPAGLSPTAQRQRQRRTAWSGPSDTSTSLRISNGPPAVDARVAPSGDHATAVTTSSCPVRVSIRAPEVASKR